MKKITLFFVCLMFAGVSALWAQDVQVSGVVNDTDGQALPGVSVVIKGTRVSTVTDINGRYSISAPGDATLVFNFLGMKDQEIAVGGRTAIDVTMESDATQLGEVVVTGYGTQSQRSMASSVAVVKSESIKDVPSPSFDQILQGRAAGVSITNPSAGVGQAPVVIIRGVSTINSGTQPLYVVDGMPMISGDLAMFGNANALADINPADIETMTILKDAAATAIYGSRAANGVILITTKKGKQGAIKVNYDMNIGFSVPTKIYETMNAKEYVEFKTKAWLNADPSRVPANSIFGIWDKDHNLIPLTWENGKITNLKEGEYIDTKWSDLIYRNGTVQNHTLSMSNATDKSDYYFSINHAKQGGIVIGDSYERSGIRANASTQANKYLKIGISANYSYAHTRNTDFARNNSTFSIAGMPRQAMILPPNIPARNQDGTPFHEFGDATGFGPNGFNCTYHNPIATYEYGTRIDTWVNRMIANAYAEITPMDGLKFKSQFGIDFAQTEDKEQWNPYHGDGASFPNEGRAWASNAKDSKWTWTNTLSYNTTISDAHNISVLAGIESSRDNFGYWDIEGRYSSDFSFMGIESNWGTYIGTGNYYERTLFSYLANLNYDYLGKYILSANFRRDGYSPLGASSRWGNFWGLAGAWRISQEGFFGGLTEIVNDLKLKASYGVVGNTEIGYYPSLSYYEAAYYGGTGALQMSVIGDSNLKWESSSTMNFGVEASLFNSRITFLADFYYKKSIDLILGVAQAPSAGIYGRSLVTNTGQLSNTGVELSISADIVRTKDFVWTSAFNVAFNKNKVLKLEEDIPHEAESTGGVTNKTVEGKSIGQLYLYPTGGVDPETGRRIFYGLQGEKVYYQHAAANGLGPGWYLEDGTLFNTDYLGMVICGNTLPTYYGGWTNTFTYKGFDLNLFFQFSGGNHIFNGMKSTGSDMRFWNNSKEVLSNHWTETNRNATYARPVYTDNVSNGSAFNMSDFVEKGDYLRLKNLSLGYTFDTRRWLAKIGVPISSVRLYAQAQNLFTITGYTGQDPETISNVSHPILNGGIDKNTLPQARSYTFGVNISF